MSNPFVLSVQDIPAGHTEVIDTSGPSPVRWGGSMLAVEEGTPVELHGTLSNVGEAIMVNAQVHGSATGTCTVCLQDIATDFDYHISDVFGFSADFIKGDDAGKDEDEPLLVEGDSVDVTQLVIDEAGLNAPFNPSCRDFCFQCLEDTPRPDGVSEEVAAEPAEDPRWAGLAKFKGLVEDAKPEENDTEGER